MNNCIMLGNLTEDPTLRYTSQGTAVCNFRIAVNSSYGDNKEVLYINIVTWKKLAESCSQYLAKGRKVLVSGRLEEKSWEQEGVKRSKVEIVANIVEFLSAKEEAPASAPESAPDSDELAPF